MADGLGNPVVCGPANIALFVVILVLLLYVIEHVVDAVIVVEPEGVEGEIGEVKGHTQGSKDEGARELRQQLGAIFYPFSSGNHKHHMAFVGFISTS